MKEKNYIDKLSIDMMSCNLNNTEDETTENILISNINNLVDINEKGRDGRTVLINAATYNCIKVVKHIISKGARINMQDEQGYTALHAAVSSNNFEIAKILLENGALTNITDIFGNTPMFRVRPSNYDMINLLLTYDANPFLKNQYGVSSYDILKNNPDIKKHIDCFFQKGDK